MIWSFVYLSVRNLFALIVLLGSSDRSKELEILVLRHELVVLRRRSGRPRIEPADRALLATLSRALPRRAWAAFSVRPETLLRWHRGLVARHWTYPHKKPGRSQVPGRGAAAAGVNHSSRARAFKKQFGASPAGLRAFSRALRTPDEPMSSG